MFRKFRTLRWVRVQRAGPGRRHANEAVRRPGQAHADINYLRGAHVPGALTIVPLLASQRGSSMKLTLSRRLIAVVAAAAAVTGWAVLPVTASSHPTETERS